MTAPIPSHRKPLLSWCPPCKRWRMTVVRKDLERVYRHHKDCPNSGRYAPPPFKEIVTDARTRAEQAGHPSAGSREP